PLRTCNYDLSPENIRSGKYSVCLEYHIKNCKGPCEGYESEAEYEQKIKGVREILKGNFKDSLHEFKALMNRYAQNLEFEEAQKVIEKIEVLENYQAKSTIVITIISNLYVFSIVSDDEFADVFFS